jgi:hypothetical protein
MVESNSNTVIIIPYSPTLNLVYLLSHPSTDQLSPLKTYTEDREPNPLFTIARSLICDTHQYFPLCNP